MYIYYAAYVFPHLRLTALHSTTGEQIWHKEIAVSPFASPLTHLYLVENVLYVENHRGAVVAIDAQTWLKLWQSEKYDLKSLRERAASGADMINLTVAYDPMLRISQAYSGQEQTYTVKIDDVYYLLTDAHLFAFDSHTKKQLWDHTCDPIQHHKKDSSITLLASKNDLFMLQMLIEESYDDYDECLYRLCSLDKTSGKTLWSVNKGGHSVISSARQEAIFFSTAQHPWSEGYRISALSKLDGRELWSTFIDDQHFQIMTCM